MRIHVRLSPDQVQMNNLISVKTSRNAEILDETQAIQFGKRAGARVGFGMSKGDGESLT